MNLTEHVLRIATRIQEWLGTKKPPEKEHLSDLAPMPDEYRERFDLFPVESPEQVVGREEERKAFREARLRWENSGQPLLIIGEPGGGMTSFLNALLPDLKAPEIFLDTHRIYDRAQLLTEISEKLALGPADSLEQLAEQCPDDPGVVIFENIERLFLRTLQGFDPLEDFLLLVNLTRRRIFWIVTVNKYPSHYLSQVTSLRSTFPTVLELKPMGKEVIESAIMDRNTGYSVVYLKPEELPFRLERRLGRAEGKEKQRHLREHYWRQLQHFADGHISRALLYWLLSVKGVRDNQVFVKPHDPGRHLSIDHEDGLLFALDSTFLHSSLSAADLERTLRFPARQTASILAILRAREWLYPRQSRQGAPEYQVNLLYQKELRALLRDKLNRKPA